LAEGHEVLHKPLVDYVKKTRAKLAFNPGTFQLKEGLKVLKPIIEVSEVMFLNKQEAQSLLKKKAKITVLLKELHSIGTKIIVITDGPKGSYCYDGKKIYHLGIFDTPVIERTGAGDAYGIAFVASLILIRDIKLAMTYGTFNSSSVVQHVGAQKGLLNREDMLKMVEKYPNASPEIYKG
jgi:sugar/nucleoside kinase (ribokinase family)